MNKRFRHRRQTFTLSGILLGLLLALSSCSFPGVVSTSEQLPQVNQAEPTPQLPPIHFPQDEGAHNKLTEWWYYTGHLNATSGDGKTHHYGFEMVIFQALRSNLPPVYASHFAISDITRGEFHYDQRRRVVSSAAIPDGTSTQGINVNVGDWSIRGLDGHDHLAASMKDYTVDLNLLARKEPVLHNKDGLITYGLAGYSYYYSRTNMEISGTIIDHGQHMNVTGKAWMDHQWGNFLTLGSGGWDWFSLQFKDNTEIMLYFIRDASGKILSTYIGYIDAQARDYLIPAQALQTSVLGSWTSPQTHITYPSGWKLTINDQHVQATLTITPQLKDQELVVYPSTGNVYWEGAVSISGQLNEKPVDGEGYIELTGYAPKTA
ncbi:carotenoid 1,2-hydratase [Ktedonosporobacter rubrisoli]|uniref:Carotenoid 1,2-hydratase n=1 Tax=Ktedonosporobacter rubrisoli TaxID=2509675 RepID=A0A4P6K3M8_KTERU|nr:lipocalin-like domain-containing protein [Ktedonosporobacter rubrisoli]QBD82380.1 carotenoid 1,2-hydratase [Ktedonosporobacter rubrisoli]